MIVHSPKQACLKAIKTNTNAKKRRKIYGKHNKPVEKVSGSRLFPRKPN
jgi:hypothetical protein